MMNSAKICDLNYFEELPQECSNDGRMIIGGVAVPSFSAQVSVSVVTRVNSKAEVSFQTREATLVYVAGFAGAAAVGASINGQATATTFAYATETP